MKDIRYYCVDHNSNLKQISENDEIVKTYNSSGLGVASSVGVEVHQLLKLEILPIDFKVAPCRELPGYYENKRKQLQQDKRELWERSRNRIQDIIDQDKKEKRSNQEVLLRVNPPSKSYFEEYDKKNDPRNRAHVPKGFFDKREGGKSSSSQDETVV